MADSQDKLPGENTPEQEKNETPPYRGLYRYVHISVKALDAIIIVCVAVILLAVFLGRQQPGMLIQFDSQGGTTVETVRQVYGELLTEPVPPTREGYQFTGWYRDTGCDSKWNFESDTVEEEITLYAGWEKKP